MSDKSQTRCSEHLTRRPNQRKNTQLAGASVLSSPAGGRTVLLWLWLSLLLILVAVVTVGSGFEQFPRQTPSVAAPVHTGSTLSAMRPASPPQTPASPPLPTVPALVRATAAPTAPPAPMATAVAAPASSPATEVPRDGTLPLTIACPSSTTDFCEFLNGVAVAENGAGCTRTFPVFTVVGKDTEPVQCTLSAASGNVVTATVLCFTNTTGTCIGTTATQVSYGRPSMDVTVHRNMHPQVAQALYSRPYALAGMLF